VFVDQAKVLLIAGKGGDGCISFRREKFVPKGGPDGGDGGRGGSIYFVATRNLKTLYDFKFRPVIKAESGKHGKGKNQTGKNGKDLEIKVPVGTVIYKKGIFFHDLVEDGEKVLVARGGKGGRGNAYFKSPTNQTPRNRELGEKGEEVEIELELKILADVGIFGFPNAGKTLFLKKISNSKAKVGSFPFTTLYPNLGAVRIFDREITFVDLPGIIENAHKGKGLGLEFLRHAERTKTILFFIDVIGYENMSAYDTYMALKKELYLYKPKILEKPQGVVLNKIDLSQAREKIKEFKRFYKGKFFAISSLTGAGIDFILKEIYNLVYE